MYYRVRIEDTIRIPPNKFSKDLANVVINIVQNTFEGTMRRRYGIIGNFSTSLPRGTSRLDISRQCSEVSGPSSSHSLQWSFLHSFSEGWERSHPMECPTRYLSIPHYCHGPISLTRFQPRVTALWEVPILLQRYIFHV